MEWKHSKTKQGQLSECRPFSCAWQCLGEKTVWVCFFWFRDRLETGGPIYQSERRSNALHLAGRTVGGLCPSVQSDCRGEPWRSASCCRRCYSGAPEKTKQKYSYIKISKYLKSISERKKITLKTHIAVTKCNFNSTQPELFISESFQDL